MTQENKVVVMKLDREEYAIEVEKIKTIEKMLPITRVPKTPSFIRGVLNLRGIVIPIIDLRLRFGMTQKEDDAQTRVIVVNVDDMEVGLIVDEANDVLSFDADSIQSPPEVIGNVKDKYVKGVVQQENNRLLILLHMEVVLDKKDLPY